MIGLFHFKAQAQELVPLIFSKIFLYTNILQPMLCTTTVSWIRVLIWNKCLFRLIEKQDKFGEEIMLYLFATANNHKNSKI